MVGIGTGLLGNLFFGLAFGLVIGWTFGSLCGLAFGLSGRRLPDRLSQTPNEGVWRSGKNGFVGLVIGQVAVLSVGLVGWVSFGLVAGQYAGVTIATPIALCVELFVVLFITLNSGLAAFVKHFFLRIFLSQWGDLPWDLVPFLDEAVERLLLRKVGGSYTFVHRLLLDYFAELAEHED
jgi:hypothetical protein